MHREEKKNKDRYRERKMHLESGGMKIRGRGLE